MRGRTQEAERVKVLLKERKKSVNSALKGQVQKALLGRECVRGIHNRHKEKKGWEEYLRYGIKHAYPSRQGIWTLKEYDEGNHFLKRVSPDVRSKEPNLAVLYRGGRTKNDWKVLGLNDERLDIFNGVKSKFGQMWFFFFFCLKYVGYL